MSGGGGRRGIPFVVAAPSGTGKTTVCRLVVERDDDVEFSVSHTTRARRPAEVDGRDYHFVSDETFRELETRGAFLESAVYNQNRYGTSWASIDDTLSVGRDVLLEIEVQGARQVRARREDARMIFLLPPSMKVLEDRLRGRGTDGPEEIARRLSVAREELRAAGEFDYAVPNDVLDTCVEAVLGILDAERAGETDALRRRFDPTAALSRFDDGS